MYTLRGWEAAKLRRRKRIESNKATHDITKAALDPTVYLAEVSLKAFQCVSFPFALAFILFIAILCLDCCCFRSKAKKRWIREGWKPARTHHIHCDINTEFANAIPMIIPSNNVWDTHQNETQYDYDNIDNNDDVDWQKTDNNEKEEKKNRKKMGTSKSKKKQKENTHMTHKVEIIAALHSFTIKYYPFKCLFSQWMCICPNVFCLNTHMHDKILNSIFVSSLDISLYMLKSHEQQTTDNNNKSSSQKTTKKNCLFIFFNSS